MAKPQNKIYESSAFGEISTTKNEPFVKGNFEYGFVPSNFREFTSGTGTTGVSNQMGLVTTGGGVGGYGAIQSFRSVNYKAGQAAMVRACALFEATDSGCEQGVGLANIGDELSFGYKDNDFGTWHRYGGLAEVQIISITVPAAGAETLTLTLNGTGYSIPLTAGTVEHNAGEIADWLRDNQSVWGADQLDNQVFVSALSDGPKSGAYSYSSSGASTALFVQQTAGVTKTSTHTKQTNWNLNTVSWLDPSKLNIYQIKYQDMAGAIIYSIMHPDTGDFIDVHLETALNSTTVPTLNNPSLRTTFYVVSFGTTEDLKVSCAWLKAAVQGEVSKTRNPRAFENTQSVGTTFTNILTIRNRRTYNGYINQVEIEPLELTIANEGSKNMEVEVRSTTTTTAQRDFTNVGTNLVSDVDVSAVEQTGGRLLAAFAVGANSSIAVDLAALEIRLPPTLNFIIQGKRASGSAADATAALIWYEDV